MRRSDPRAQERPGRARIRYAQNLFRDAGAVRELVKHAAVAPELTVYDLGAGTGMITAELVRAGARVVAVERDPNLARKLRERFKTHDVTVLETDISEVDFQSPFTVAANIPFNLTAATLKRLLVTGPFPREAVLVLQREAARKYAGIPRQTEVSLKAKPWFELDVVHSFRADDFVPAPGVAVVALRVRERRTPLLASSDREDWQRFVGYAFARSRPVARQALKPVFSHLQWKLLARDLGFDPEVRLTELTVEQWTALFRFFRESASPARRRLVPQR